MNDESEKLGTGTVEIGDPSGRTSARSKQTQDAQRMNKAAMKEQLMKLWSNVNALGVKHQFPADVGRHRRVLQNGAWLSKLSAIELLSSLGSGMRLGPMLARDSYVVGVPFIHPLSSLTRHQCAHAHGERQWHVPL